MTEMMWFQRVEQALETNDDDGFAAGWDAACAAMRDGRDLGDDVPDVARPFVARYLDEAQAFALAAAAMRDLARAIALAAREDEGYAAYLERFFEFGYTPHDPDPLPPDTWRVRMDMWRVLQERYDAEVAAWRERMALRDPGATRPFPSSQLTRLREQLCL